MERATPFMSETLLGGLSSIHGFFHRRQELVHVERFGQGRVALRRQFLPEELGCCGYHNHSYPRSVAPVP